MSAGKNELVFRGGVVEHQCSDMNEIYQALLFLPVMNVKKYGPKLNTLRENT